MVDVPASYVSLYLPRSVTPWNPNPSESASFLSFSEFGAFFFRFCPLFFEDVETIAIPMWKLKGKPFPPGWYFTGLKLFWKKPMALDESRWGTQDFTPFFVEMIFRPLVMESNVISFSYSMKIVAYSFLTNEPWDPGSRFHMDPKWPMRFGGEFSVRIRDCRVLPRLNFNELRGPKRTGHICRPFRYIFLPNHHFW